MNAAQRTEARPLVVGALLGTSGWIAGLFLLFFVGTLFKPHTALEAATSGAVLLAAARAFFYVDRDERLVFLSQLALTMSIAGQFMVLWAVNLHTVDLHKGGNWGVVAYAAVLLQSVLALAMPNRLHRTLSALFACIAWGFSLHYLFFGGPGVGFARGWHMASTPVVILSWLAGWALPVAGLAALVRGEPAWTQRAWAPVLRPLSAGLTIGLMFATLAAQPLGTLRGIASAGIAMWPLLSAAIALAALAAAFAQRRRALMAVGAVALLLHVSHFYYALGASLLFKSLLMLAMGGVLLMAAHVLKTREAP